MPEPYWPKTKDYPLSRLNTGGIRLVRFHCVYCKRTQNYYPSDLIQVFGDVDVDSLMHRTKCEKCNGRIDVTSFSPVGSDAVGLKIRRLVAIKIRHIPVWKEE